MLARTLLAPGRLRRISAPTRAIRFNSNQVPERPVSWLTRKVLESPKNQERFLKLAKFIGYGTPKGQAPIRTFVLYERVCCLKADQDQAFWREVCGLPPTFQSWFTVTTLHIWMLTEYGKRFGECIVDHYFQDVEDRVRYIMQPSHDYTPYMYPSTFYLNPNAPKTNDKKERLARAPDRLVSQQLKIFKEQWTGFCLAFDLALVNGDMEMAAAVWRNLLGARGASGIAFPDDPSAPSFRRAVNLLGGTVVNPAKVDFDKEAVTDDGSGLMLEIVKYVRRELVRLESLSDEEIVSISWDEMAFGRVREDKTEAQVP
ncbi:hypothetical protein FB45DRAFT_893715 [Roridomyces roridus]|uniref:Ubiquinol-cytochrome c chaperone domain-containing protein n=1 Tax=Roridomyces roridus TaxID=1738132 RepID=A0AAD7CFP8_9AGAR|nr:hypothetical protein FB45DRAFT_893715 [Roridomyces roridus]